MDIATGLGIAKTSLDLIRGIREGLKKKTLSNEEIVGYFSDLQDRIGDMKIALSDAENENRRLRRQLDDQQRHLDLTADLEFVIDGGFYVRKSEADKGLIAYCPICWQKDKVTLPLTSGSTAGWYRCDVHTTSYETSEYRNRPRTPPLRGPVPNSWMR
jgi:hypothetical protein